VSIQIQKKGNKNKNNELVGSSLELANDSNVHLSLHALQGVTGGNTL